MKLKPVTASLILLICIAAAGCAALQPPNTGGPRPPLPAYPVVLNEDDERLDVAIQAAEQLLAVGGRPATDIKLQPVTGTIQRLPASGAALFLPAVGTSTQMSDEETRESLRRFIDSWRVLIGADPSQLSLTGWEAQANGVKVAAYEQRPFRYPLRGAHGKLRIEFAADRKVLSLSSTCIPGVERLQTALGNITATVTPEDAERFVRENALVYSDAGGNRQTVRLAAGASVKAGELVYYTLPAGADSIEFHLAWAVNVTNAPFKTVYLDALNTTVLGVS
jgi:hypothetical protein